MAQCTILYFALCGTNIVHCYTRSRPFRKFVRRSPHIDRRAFDLDDLDLFALDQASVSPSIGYAVQVEPKTLTAASFRAPLLGSGDIAGLAGQRVHAGLSFGIYMTVRAANTLQKMSPRPRRQSDRKDRKRQKLPNQSKS